LRDRATSAEHRLWSTLRNRQLGGLKFVRQFPVGPYFADFLCRDAKLIVEVDGATHVTGAEISADEIRTAFLIAQRYRVVRVRNEEVYDGLDVVLDRLLVLIKERAD
jgi:very-short-patch-repair endonuclease